MASLAHALRLDLTDDELTQYRDIVAGVLDSHRRIDELSDTPYLRETPTMSGYRPGPDENPHRGWVWRCSIPGNDSGPLAGKRVAIKDNTAVAGVPMLNGTSLMEGYVPQEDATVVQRLRTAGAEIIGKTTVPCLSFDATGITCYPEQPCNPHDSDYASGGSSAGSAIVVATGEADLALGGDQAGSIRMPASWSGCCGHKPTYGLVPYTGAFPIEQTLDHLGPMAATVTGCAEMLDVLAGEDSDDPRQYTPATGTYAAELERGCTGMRIGVLREGFDWPGLSETEVDAAVQQAADTLVRAGATVEDISIPWHRDGITIWNVIGVEGANECLIQGDGVGTNWRGRYQTSLADIYGSARRLRANELSPSVIAAGLTGTYMSRSYQHHYYAKAQNLARALRDYYAEALQTVDALIMPTTPMTAVRRPDNPSIADTFRLSLATNLHNTTPFNVTGHPALSVPVAHRQPVCRSDSRLSAGTLMMLLSCGSVAHTRATGRRWTGIKRRRTTGCAGDNCQRLSVVDFK